MKYSRSQVQRKVHALPQLRFEDQALTSFAGLVMFQKFFASIDLKSRLRRCFEPLRPGKVFHPATVFLQLIVHLLLGFRELQDGRYYRDDPLVQRLLGLRRLPNVATISRVLKQATAQSVETLRRFLRERVLDGLRRFQPARVTLDFDGSVLSTQRRAEGTAVGFNKKKKGARSYYPLFCTMAQTGQVLDFLYRPGNVHDSHGAEAFILACIQAVRGTTAKRTCRWVFEKVDTLRKTLLQRAGRLTRPQGTLTLTLSANSWIQTRLLYILDQIPANA